MIEDLLTRIAVALETIAAQPRQAVQAETVPDKPKQAKKKTVEVVENPTPAAPSVEPVAEAPAPAPEIAVSPVSLSEPEPEPKPALVLTKEHVMAAAIVWGHSHSRDDLPAVLSPLGVTYLRDLKPEQYAQAIALLEI